MTSVVATPGVPEGASPAASGGRVGGPSEGAPARDSRRQRREMPSTNRAAPNHAQPAPNTIQSTAPRDPRSLTTEIRPHKAPIANGSAPQAGSVPSRTAAKPNTMEPAGSKSSPSRKAPYAGAVMM